MERFYGKGRHTLQPATAHNDVQNKFEKLSETLLDLQEEQRNNAAAIRCVMQRVETIAKDVDDLKKQLSQRTQATSQSQACKRIPSALSVSYVTKGGLGRRRGNGIIYKLFIDIPSPLLLQHSSLPLHLHHLPPCIQCACTTITNYISTCN